MDKEDARTSAAHLLELIIKSQPNLFTAQNTNSSNGSGIAEFCSTFTERYAEYLVSRPRSGD